MKVLILVSGIIASFITAVFIVELNMVSLLESILLFLGIWLVTLVVIVYLIHKRGSVGWRQYQPYEKKGYSEFRQ